MWYLYIIESEKDGIHYIGICKDVDRSLKEHNSDKNRFTKGHLLWKLLYKEEFTIAEQARTREKYFKSGAGRRCIKDKIKRVVGSPHA